MKGFLKFILIFGGILLLSAFLAPIFYDFLPEMMKWFGVDKVFKFERVFQRIVMILSLISVVFFVRVKKETFTSYGAAWKPQSLKLLIKGFLLGVAVLGAVGFLRVFMGRTVFEPDVFSWGGWISKFALALGTGLLIGIIEEFFFRGFIFRSLMNLTRSRVFLSVLITTSFYAIIHFIGMKKVFVDSTPTFIDGLRMIGAPFLSLAAWPQFWPEAVGLFLFGLALVGVAYKSGSLYPAIGLHAGCVFFVKLDDSFLQFSSERTFFWGSKILYDGFMGWFFLGLMALVLWVAVKPSGSAKVEAAQE